MAYNPIGADENGNLPPAVRAKLEQTYATLEAAAGLSQVVDGKLSKTTADATYGPIRANEVDASLYTVGDGVADDTGGLQEALTAAAGKTLVLSGRHKVTASLVPPLTAPTTIVSRAGAEVFTGANVPIIKHWGSHGSAVAVTAGGTANATTITVADPAPFVVGGYALLSCDNTIAGIASVRGMLVRITDKSGSVLTIDRPVYPVMGTTNPVLYPLTMAPALQVSGGTFYHTNPLGASGQKVALFDVACTVNPRWRDGTLRDGGGPGVSVSHVFGGSFEGDISDLTDDLSTGHFGYGINLCGGTRDFQVRRGTAVRTRHAVTTNGAGGPSGISAKAEPLSCSVSADFAVSGNINSGLDTHEPGYDIRFDPNVTGCKIGVTSRSTNTRIGRGRIGGASLYSVYAAASASGTVIEQASLVDMGAGVSGACAIYAGSKVVLDGTTVAPPPAGVATVLGSGEVELRGGAYAPSLTSVPGTLKRGLLGREAVSLTPTKELKALMSDLLGLPAGGKTPLDLEGGAFNAGSISINGTPVTGATVDIQVFTSNGTWTKPAGAKRVTAIAIGPGAGGGSGRRGAPGTVRCGGGGGGPGAMTRADFLADDLPATVAVIAPQGGAGGASVTTDDTNGNNGTAGSNAGFGNFVRAAGGFASNTGGTAATGTGGTAAPGMFAGANGGTASTTGGGGTTSLTAQSGPSGGGSGAGLTTGNTESAGGGANPPQAYTSNNPAVGGAAGGNSGTVAPDSPTGVPGTGGPGGGSAAAAPGGSGLPGSKFGAGGGGGSASANGFPSGAGGAGGPSVVVVISQ